MPSIEPCDHTSVGILVFRDGKLLIIDRKRPPLGLAAPAGHVDKHANPDDPEEARYERAALEELEEETGLRATHLELLWYGRKENPCRRPGGGWHYWRVYLAKVEGELKPSTEETRGHIWCDKERMKHLLDGGSIDMSGRQAGLEPVWRQLFADVAVLKYF